MKNGEVSAIAKVIREYVAKNVDPLLRRLHALEARCEQLKTRIRMLESTKAVTPPSTANKLPVVRLKNSLPVVRLGTGGRRGVVRL